MVVEMDGSIGEILMTGIFEYISYLKSHHESNPIYVTSLSNLANLWSKSSPASSHPPLLHHSPSFPSNQIPLPFLIEIEQVNLPI